MEEDQGIGGGGESGEEIGEEVVAVAVEGAEASAARGEGLEDGFVKAGGGTGGVEFGLVPVNFGEFEVGGVEAVFAGIVAIGGLALG
ncbi:MAG: hypothetical protein HY821_01600 [Acidobacteria bacterium]|nr:hypothetical protein [Acidobacteriota bacterium]